MKNCVGILIILTICGFGTTAKAGGNMDVNKVVKALEGVINAVREQSETVKVSESTRFKKLSDGWIKDLRTGLEWGPSSAKKMNWEDAKSYCEKSGGRLPERFELESILDLTKYNPAIDKDFFHDTKTDDYYWSNTTYAVVSGSAWVVDFYSGDVSYCYKGGGNYVWPVRSSQCLII